METFNSSTMIYLDLRLMLGMDSKLEQIGLLKRHPCYLTQKGNRDPFYCTRYENKEYFVFYPYKDDCVDYEKNDYHIPLLKKILEHALEEKASMYIILNRWGEI